MSTTRNLLGISHSVGNSSAIACVLLSGLCLLLPDENHTMAVLVNVSAFTHVLGFYPG